MKPNAPLRLYLKTLEPIHVGCDEVYEPTGFCVDTQKRHLSIFEPLDFINSLTPPDRAKLSAICQKGTPASILELYKFMRNRPIAGRRVPVCAGLIAHYQQVLKLTPERVRNELNNFQIQRTVFRAADQRPYIPGSAIKGALRTAFLNSLAKTDRSATPRGKRAHKDLEQKLLNLDRIKPGERISKDPFRLVKVSDFAPVGESGTMVLYVVNKKKVGDQLGQGPYQILEIIPPGTVFTGALRVDAPLRADAVSMPIDLQKLLNSCHHFYNQEKERETHQLQQAGIQFKSRMGPQGTCLIRLGRHSGAESVTIDGHRSIKIMQGRGNQPKYLDRATTFWLVSGTRQPAGVAELKPFGWAFLGGMSAENEQRMAEIEAQYRRQAATAPRPQPGPSPKPAANAVTAAAAPPAPKPPKTPERETWTDVTLTWAPGPQEVTAMVDGKKAIGKGKPLVPERYHKKLFGRKKRVSAASVQVESAGNAYRIVKIC